MKIGRNEPCPCGSGKKYKKCCVGKKPRYKTVRSSFGKSIDMSKGQVAFRINPQTGLPEVSLDGKVIPCVDVSFGNYMEKRPGDGPPVDVHVKDKSKKITSYFPVSDIGNIRIAGEPLLNFDWVLSVDTSYPKGDPGGRCCAGIVSLIKSRESNSFLIEKAFVVEFNQSKYPPEKSGWILAIESIKNILSHGKRVGIIVDYDLNNIEEYNSRESEIVEDYPLPESCGLIYASSDFKNDGLCNRLIWLSDILSKTDLASGFEFVREINGNFFADGKVYEVSAEKLASILNIQK